MIPFATREMTAGIRNSPMDWRYPTKVNANPVKMIMGKRMRVSSVASACAAGSSPGAIQRTSGEANAMPRSASMVVTRRMNRVYDCANASA